MNVEQKKILIKSKSSNTAMTKNDSDSKNEKKCKSHGEFQPSVLKKRGVYVERTSTKTGLNNHATRPKNLQETTSPSRTRDGKSKFFNSVLNILSKSTAGTQFPISMDSFGHSSNNSPDRYIEDNQIRNLLDSGTKRKKRLFRSKVLNSGINNADDIVILKKQHLIEQTSSNISNASNPNLGTSNDTKSGKQALKDDAEFATVQEPTTLVATNQEKKDAKVYKLFVDLLTTTLNDDEKPPELPAKVEGKKKVKVFEIEEEVADKLILKEDVSSHTNFDADQKNDFEIRLNTNKNALYSENLLDIEDDDYYANTTKKKKPKSKKNKNIKNKTHFTMRNKMFNKQDLINILKKELSEDPFAYHEPQNFYEALTAIAVNKRKYHEQLIKYNTKHREAEFSSDEDEDRHICRYKKRTKRPKGKMKTTKKIATPIKPALKKSMTVDYGYIDYDNDFDFDEPSPMKRTDNVIRFDPELPEINSTYESQVFELPVQNITVGNVVVETYEDNELKNKKLETDFDFDSSVSNISFSQSESFIEPSETESED